MASYKGESSVFTGNPMGGSPGESGGLKRTKYPSGTHLSAYPQDNVHGVNLPDTRGGSFGGGVTNLGHSLDGASAVEHEKKAPRSGKRTGSDI